MCKKTRDFHCYLIEASGALLMCPSWDIRRQAQCFVVGRRYLFNQAIDRTDLYTAAKPVSAIREDITCSIGMREHEQTSWKKAGKKIFCIRRALKCFAKASRRLN